MSASAQDIDADAADVDTTRGRIEPLPYDPGDGSQSYCTAVADEPIPVERDAWGVLPFLAAPTSLDEVSWELRGWSFYGSHREQWTTALEGDGPWEIVLPDEVFADGYQTSWLTRIRLSLLARSPNGGRAGSWAVEPLYIVWPDGVNAVWLDEPTQEAVAPSRAYGLDAQLLLPPDALYGTHVTVAVPEGGAL